jgi:hypothetical protein
MRSCSDKITHYLLQKKEEIEQGKIKKADICKTLGICEKTAYNYLHKLNIKTLKGGPQKHKKQRKVTNFTRIIRLEKTVKTLARVLHEVQTDIGAKPHPGILDILKGRR